MAASPQAWLSVGQHDGQAPPVSCGSSPGLQKSSWAKQSQVWSGVFENDWPGQQPTRQDRGANNESETKGCNEREPALCGRGHLAPAPAALCTGWRG